MFKQKLFFSIFFFGFQLITSAQSNIDVIHYKFQIILNDANDTIYGVAEINVKFLQPSNQLNFDLALLNDKGKGMVVGKVEGAAVRGTMAKEEKIIILLSKTFVAGDTASFVIPYQGIPADGLIISKTKYGRRSFFADNWPDRGHNWLPCHEDPADKATVEFIVTAPVHYQVVANGIQVEESSNGNGNKLTHWKEETPISTKVMVIGVADFAVHLAGFVNDRIPVYSWVYPENKDKGFYDFALAKDILPFFINKVGQYGYKKLANVQSKTRFGGLENANTIFYSESSVTGTRRSEGLLAHEIAHQWFGNMATEKSFGHLWLSEGFATYFTILYFENKYGQDTAISMLKEDRKQVISFSKRNNTSVVNTEEKDYMKLLNENSYQKGGWALHMLRRELGDSIFWKSIRKYYATYAGSIAGTEDLQKVFEEVSGKNLTRFFTQWLYTPGQPLLNFKWEYNESSKTLKMNIEQLQKQLFEFPLEIKIVYGGGKFLYKRINISKQSESFIVAVKEKPTDLVPDPYVSLLFEESWRN
jgi:aminopeptidase N